MAIWPWPWLWLWLFGHDHGYGYGYGYGYGKGKGKGLVYGHSRGRAKCTPFIMPFLRCKLKGLIRALESALVERSGHSTSCS
eukprot:880527-Pleurochrysis_carterae.AAC.1